jgi:hypothetical protein
MTQQSVQEDWLNHVHMNQPEEESLKPEFQGSSLNRKGNSLIRRCCHAQLNSNKQQTVHCTFAQFQLCTPPLSEPNQ